MTPTPHASQFADDVPLQPPTPPDRAADLDKLKFCRAEIRDEYSLMSGRVSTLISSQSFLIIAYASALNNQIAPWAAQYRLVFPLLLSTLGVVISLQSWWSIRAAMDTISLWHGGQNALVARDPRLEEYRVHRLEVKRRNGELVDITHERSMVFARWMPLTFGVSWIALGALALLLHAWH